MIKIPTDIAKLLEAEKIPQDDIAGYAKSDISPDCKYINSHIVLTKDKLILFYSPQHPDDCVKFRDCDMEPKKTFFAKAGRKLKKIYGKFVKEKTFEYRYKMVSVALSEIDNIDFVRNVSGGILYFEKNSEEKIIGAFTNLSTGNVMALVDKYKEITHKSDMTLKIKGGPHGRYHGSRPDGPPDRKMPGEDEKKKTSSKGILWRTLKYFKPYIPHLAVMFISYVIAAAVNLAWPYLNGTVLYDYVFTKNEKLLEMLRLPSGQFVIALSLVVITMVFAKVIMQLSRVTESLITAYVVPKVINRIKTDIFTEMEKLSLSFFESRQTGGLMTRVMSDAGTVAGFFIDTLPYAFVHGFSAIAMLITMFYLEPYLAAASVMLLPVLFVISLKMLPKLWSIFGRRHRAERRLNSRTIDNLYGARVIRAFGKESNETNHIEKYNVRLKEAELDIVRFDNRYHALYSATQNIASLIVWGLGSYFIISRTDFNLGMLITFVGYVSQLQGPLEFFSGFFRSVTNTLNSAQRMYDIIDAKPDVFEIENPISPEKIKGEVVIENLSFGYEPNRPVLKHINLSVPAGSTLGIVGRSGAGKSTLVSLISRLYDPDEGNIYIDGANLKDLSFASLKGNVAMVSQDTYIFTGTAYSNIAYARPEATPKEVLEAAVLAGAHDFICKMPDGYDTLIGPSGRGLSGGERQRISIARAILADPAILILDEATASVDTETEMSIQRSLTYLSKSRTTISIAHRLSTLREADYIVVIEDGEIAEEGTQKELSAKKGIYYKLKELQTKALALKAKL